MATQTLSIPPTTYQPGLTSTIKNLPGGQAYTQAHITADVSPWTSPATTLVRLGISVSFDRGVTYQEVTHTDEITPPPWPIPAKYGGGFSSMVAVDAFESISPDHAMGWVYVEGAAVALGQITITLQ